MNPDSSAGASPRDASASSAGTGANWWNGETWRDDEVEPGPGSLAADRGLILGDGLYETLRLRDGRPVLFHAHLDRMEETAAALEFPLPAGFRRAVAEAIDVLHPRLDEPPMAWLRITVTRGVAPPGVGPPANPRPALLVRMVGVEPQPLAPLRAWVVDRPRTDPQDPLAGRKTISCMRFVLANQAARRHGADIAILRTVEGDLAEADTASVFAVREGTVVTPPLSRGILPSTTRHWILERLRQEGRPATERRLELEELEDASEVFISSSVVGIRPLSAVQDHTLPDEVPVCSALSEGYEELPGDLEWG